MPSLPLGSCLRCSSLPSGRSASITKALKPLTNRTELSDSWPRFPTGCLLWLPVACAPAHPLTSPTCCSAPRHTHAAGGYISYLVTTRVLADAPGGYTRGSEMAVRRRFNDFVALSSALKVCQAWGLVRRVRCMKASVQQGHASPPLLLSSASSPWGGRRAQAQPAVVWALGRQAEEGPLRLTGRTCS